MTRREYGAVVLIALAAAALISLLAAKRRGRRWLFVFTAILAVLLRIFYIWYTPTYVRQHDVIGFGNSKGIGQAALIEYLMENRRLPDFDPRTRWGFFQPMLHHIIAALWLRANLFLGFTYEAATENIQILTLIYSLIFTLYAYRIYKEAGLSGRPLFLSTALTALHPSFILLSGSVNNDMLCLCLLVMSLFYALRWYRDSTFPNILKTALCIGGSMMAKLMGVLAAPAIAFIFLYKLIKDGKGKIKGYIKQFLAFGIVSFPLGLFFPLRNLICFRVPLSFTPAVGEGLEGYSLFERLFDIRTNTPFANMVKNGNPFNEYNVPLALMKTSLTGEYNYGAENQYITPFAWVLLICGSVLAVLALYATIRTTFMQRAGTPITSIIRDKEPCTSSADIACPGSIGKKAALEFPIKIFFAILYFTGIAFYIKLVFGSPYFSSQDFRYIAYLLVPEALYLGLLCSEGEVSGKIAIAAIAEEKAEGAGKGSLLARFPYILSVLVLIFSLSSAGVYFLLGLP